jgi:hypothetical protein
VWSPELGAFLEADEFGFLTRTGTLWSWPGQNPLRYRDPYGRYGLEDLDRDIRVHGESVENALLATSAIAATIATGGIAGSLLGLGTLEGALGSAALSAGGLLSVGGRTLVAGTLGAATRTCSGSSDAATRVPPLMARVRALGTDPVRGFVRSEGVGGARIEQALGRTISRSPDAAADFVDTVLGPISLKGPLPAVARGNVQGLANAAINDALYNTATKALFVDLRGLGPAAASQVQSLIGAGASGSTKQIFFLP